MFLIIDNYDSFTYNIIHYIEGLGYAVTVKTPDELTIDDIIAMHPKAIILSPGPGHPLEAELCCTVVTELAEDYPILGICLGFQVIVSVLGGSVRQGQPVHGHQMMMDHDGRTLFEGLPRPLNVGRYHSLHADWIPSCLEVSARCGEVVMAVRHKTLPIEGVQYHPESILTDYGREQLNNFLKVYV